MNGGGVSGEKMIAAPVTPPNAALLQPVHDRDPVTGGALAAHVPQPRLVRRARLSRNVTPRPHVHATGGRGVVNISGISRRPTADRDDSNVRG
jgi:hypothetical protein